ncbi:MAG: IS481 family transposase [Actinomycetota bacterium]|nr:IS481 family transposase [Actinomycetota bacterium]
MTLHRNARTCPRSRRLIAKRVLEQGWSLAVAAEAAGVSEPTARKWVRRFREHGEAGLQDRSSAPGRVPHRTPRDREQAILKLRAVRFTGPQIAELLQMPASTVSLILKRNAMGRLPSLNAGPANRYERKRAGELIHIDIKKLGRIARPGHRVTGSRAVEGYHRQAYEQGWEFVHVCVDDATRLAYAEVLPDERPSSCIAFLHRALRFFASLGVRVERVMTDNGNPYRSKAHAAACRELGLRHLRTRAYRPQTNGKAERFIKTMLEGWAYGAIYGSSTERTLALPGWLDRYNRRRPHRSIGRKPPMQRLLELNNVGEAHS